MKKYIPFLILLSCSSPPQLIKTQTLSSNCLIAERINKISETEQDEILNAFDEVKSIEEYLALPNHPAVIKRLKEEHQRALFNLIVLKTKHDNTIKVLSLYRGKCKEENK